MDSKKEEEQSKNLTPEELLIMKRNAKRRSVKYKTKHVHTKNKSATEITREVINGQMEAYEHWLHNELNLETASNSTASQEKSYHETNSPISSSKQNSIEEGETRSNGSKTIRSPSPESDRSKYSDKSKYYKYNRKRERSRDKSKSPDREYYKHRHHRSSRDRYDDRRYKHRSDRSDKYRDSHYKKTKRY